MDGKSSGTDKNWAHLQQSNGQSVTGFNVMEVVFGNRIFQRLHRKQTKFNKTTQQTFCKVSGQWEVLKTGTVGLLREHSQSHQRTADQFNICTGKQCPALQGVCAHCPLSRARWRKTAPWALPPTFWWEFKSQGNFGCPTRDLMVCTFHVTAHMKGFKPICPFSPIFSSKTGCFSWGQGYLLLTKAPQYL